MGCLLSVFNFVAKSLTSQKTSDDDQNPIYMFQDPSNPKVVIIFFHDILWGGQDQQLHKSTWMSSSDPPVSWPETWLGDKYPEAQILSTHYNVGAWKGKVEGVMDLYQLTENLRHDILPIYRIDCPAFLVGHGLGGLVIKAVIQGMQLTRDELARKSPSKASRDGRDLCKLESFLKNVKGILYYDTPFMGSKLANSMKDLPCTDSLLDALRNQNKYPCRLNEWFRNWRCDHQKCIARMIWANDWTKVDVWYGPLVEEASARYDVDDFYAFGCNHLDVCKPRDTKNDVRFRWLIDLIDPVMLATEAVPETQVEDKAKAAATKSVQEILQKLGDWKDREGLGLKLDDLIKIRRFVDLWGTLEDGLKATGLRYRGADACFEYWE